MKRATWIRAAVVAGLAVFAVAFGVRLGWMYVVGDFAGESYAHPAPDVWRWQPWIHPPVYGEYMRLIEAISDRFWVGEELVAFWSGGVFAAVLTVLGAIWAHRTWGPWWALPAAGLLALAASNLRPFENYPPGRTLIFGGAWLLLTLHQRGSPASRRLLAATLLVLWTAVELHLSSWFVLGPLWFFLMLVDRGVTARARLHAVGILAWLVAFGLSTYPGLFRVLEEGPGEGRLGDGSVQWSHVTLEWTNPLLFAPLLLWAAPSVRRGHGGWVAASLAVVVYTGITWALMAHNLAIGGPMRASHHYFELVDPLLAMCALAALHAACCVTAGGLRRAVLGAVVALVASQVAWYVRSYLLLREMAEGWTR